jgi:DNA-binding HxlR family transcriptional regulator
MLQHFIIGEAGKMPRKKPCPICETLRLLNGKWDLMVIRYLLEGPKRFAELKAAIPGLSSKSLSATLKQLIAKGIVRRNVNTSYPVSVVYSLTAKGHDMKDTVEALRHWGQKWLPA